MKKLIALLLAMMMVFALCACGGGDKAEEPAPAADAAPAAPDGAAPAGAPEGAVAPPEGEASEEPSGEPVAELYPTDGYEKSFEGYKEYVVDALESDEHAPPEIVDMTVAAIGELTEADADSDTFGMMINQGRIVSFDDFMK